MDRSTGSDKDLSVILAESAEFGDYDHISRRWFEEFSNGPSIDQPQLSTMHASAVSLQQAACNGMAMYSSGSSASLAQSSYMTPEIPRRLSSANSLHAMNNSSSFASFSGGSGGYYGNCPSYGGDYYPFSPFTTADDTNIIEELFDQDMGIMLGSDVLGATRDSDMLPMSNSACQLASFADEKSSWQRNISLDILEEVGSQIDATSYVEPDAKSSAETFGSARSICLEQQQQTAQEEDYGYWMDLDETANPSGDNNMLKPLADLDENMLLTELQASLTSENLIVAPHLLSATFEELPQAGFVQPLEDSASVSAFGLLDFVDPDEAITAYNAVPVVCGGNVTNGGSVGDFGLQLSSVWNTKQQSPPVAAGGGYSMLQPEDDNALFGTLMRSGIADDDDEYESAAVTVKKSKSRRSCNVADEESAVDPTWLPVVAEADVKKSLKMAGKKRVGKLPTSRVISPRKRVQNRDAAQRYRRRKRDEEKNAEQTIEQLEQAYDDLLAERQNWRQEFDILRSLLSK